MPFSRNQVQPFSIPFVATPNAGGGTERESLRVYFSDQQLRLSAVGTVEGDYAVYPKSELYRKRGGLALEDGFGPANSEPDVREAQVVYILET